MNLKLGEISFNEAYLSGGGLSEPDLRGLYLRGSDLIGSDLVGTDLIGSDLRGTNLVQLQFGERDLIGTNLQDTILDDVQVGILENMLDLSNSRVYNSEGEKIVSYKEYCIWKETERK